MNQVTHLIVSDAGLIGSVYQNANPFLDAAYVISIGDVFYTSGSFGGAVACAIRNLPKSASLVGWKVDRHE